MAAGGGGVLGPSRERRSVVQPQEFVEVKCPEIAMLVARVKGRLENVELAIEKGGSFAGGVEAL